MRKTIIAVITLILLLVVSTVHAEGILPSLTATVGIAMPSLGEAIRRYPDSETENGDGSITELYTNISESDFNDFSVYLQQQGAELADYKVEKGVLSAEIRSKGAAFSLSYDSKSGEVRVIYPSGTFDEWVKNAKTHFDAAQKLLAEGKTDEAYAEISAIPQFTLYGPVDSLMKEDESFAIVVAVANREAKLAPFREAGNVISFGAYSQTKEGTDQTPIEWIVLDYDEANHKTLLLSRYGLDAVPYNKEYTDITWEQCTLRAWLNREFLNRAFSAEEQYAILVTNVDNSSDQGYSKWDTNGGNNTQDQIFLLSYAEANRYLGIKPWEGDDGNNTKSCVAPTAYAIAHGAYSGDSKQKMLDGVPAGWWWLRSPGGLQKCVAAVLYVGAFRYYASSAENGVIRPAFWLNLDSDIF